MPKIIAIQGLPGSGKTVTIEYLQQRFGWPKVYFGDVTFDEMKVRGLEINEANERMVREGLRADFGLLHYARQVIKKLEAMTEQPVILVESLYSWEEYKLFKEKFGDDFILLAIYSSPETRYDRLVNREIRPLQRSDAISRDHAQIENLTQAGPIAMANFTIVNEGTIDDLNAEIDKTISLINK